MISEGNVRKLILKSSTLSDEGEYTCVLGELECTAELGVRELPAEIVRKMSDQSINKGSKATFEVFNNKFLLYHMIYIFLFFLDGINIKANF